MKSTYIYICALICATLFIGFINKKGIASLSLTQLAVQAIIVYTVGLIVFPIMAVPLLNDMIIKVEDLVGNKINRELVMDFNSSSFLVSIASTIEILLIIIWIFRGSNIVLDCIILGNLVSLVVLFFTLIIFMWILINNYYESQYDE
ncbi:MAG: hypothetical protein GSR72_00105 [Desulfurococcales archaeon]|nr:hypothetical protein [Desulfurococcales archaeon]